VSASGPTDDLIVESSEPEAPSPGTGSEAKPTPGTGPSLAPIPETVGYRIKKKLLGPPLVSERLGSERLGKPTALAVLSSDVMSSSAYATEQILFILVPVVGLAAYSLVVPITGAILLVLAFVTLSYREVVRAYPKAGGSYVVARENFGPAVAQIAAAALLISYTITVSVSVAAGTDAIVSAVPGAGHFTLPLSVLFVVLLAFGNLRGLREAGKAFAIPTYFFITNMVVLISIGLARWATGSLHAHSLHQHGALPAGHGGGGLLLGASAFFVLRAFANGGSAMTGTEAISNGVSVFRDPQPRNARQTLVLMSVILGAMFLGVSILAAVTHAVPFASGTPTVISQVGKFVFGSGALGSALYAALQVSTALILILAANTSFTGFPFLVSFVASDSFLPRQLTVRGHRLVFSNGITLLAVAAIALLLATGARVASLIPMYAIGVFTGFTIAGIGMVKHHLTERQGSWRRSVWINATSAVVCFVVAVVFAVTEFTRGAWIVVVLLPLIVAGLMRLNHQYRQEEAILQDGAALAVEAPVLRRHVVVVLIDSIDLASARAIQYARTLNPDELRAMHFVLDAAHAHELGQQWSRLGLSRLPLELYRCPDRRLARAALEVAAELVAGGETEVSVLLPRRAYRRAWARLLHDQTADKIVEAVSQLPHVNATIVPFHLTGSSVERIQRLVSARDAARHGRPAPSGARYRGTTGSWRLEEGSAAMGEPVVAGQGKPGGPPASAVGAGSDLAPRRAARVSGVVLSLRVQPFGGVPSLEATIEHDSGRVNVIFLGRRHVPGVEVGTRMLVEGMVGTHRGKPQILNPHYELLGAVTPTG
jgi:amino acid transporter